MTDDGIREVHGCAASRRMMAGDQPGYWITVREVDGDMIEVSAMEHGRTLTRWQARYLASKLYRLSRRIRERDGGDA